MRTPLQKQLCGSLAFIVPLTIFAIVGNFLFWLRMQPALECVQAEALQDALNWAVSSLRYDVEANSTCTMNYLMTMNSPWHCFQTPDKQNEYAQTCQFPDMGKSTLAAYNNQLIAVGTGASSFILTAAYIGISSLVKKWRALHSRNPEIALNNLKQSIGNLSCDMIILSIITYGISTLTLFLLNYNSRDNIGPCSALADTLDAACNTLSPINITHPARFFPHCHPNATIGTYRLQNFTSADIPVHYNAAPDCASLNILMNGYPLAPSMAGVGLAHICYILLMCCKARRRETEHLSARDDLPASHDDALQRSALTDYDADNDDDDVRRPLVGSSRKS